MLMTLEKETKSSVAATVSAKVVSTTDELARMKEQWCELFAISPTASPPLRFEWVWRWWAVYGQAYGKKGRGLRVIAFWSGEKLVGVLPLFESSSSPPLVGMRRLQFISTGAAEFEETCAEYLNLLHAPQEDSACMDALANLLQSDAIAWDELHLLDMPETSPLLSLTERIGKGRQVKMESAGISYISDLAGGMENFIAALSMTTRRKGRKMLKQLSGGQGKLEVAQTAEQAGEFFDQMVQVHRKRWQSAGRTGSFAPRHAEFHRGIAVELAPRGEVMVARLMHNGEVLALTYGHRVGPRYDGYQVGVNMQSKVFTSPGSAMHLALMEYLAERGVTSYDHLKGFNRFKQDYAKTLVNLVDLTITKPNLRVRAHRMSDLCARVARKLLRNKKAAVVAPQSAESKEESGNGEAD
jgi:CelD/BcsL family acetyltransferase involved in cellulose biosynthesis